MAIIRYNICTVKTYQKDGEEKKAWLNVGSMVFFPANGDKQAGYKLELNMYPGTQFFVFKQEPKDAPKAPAQEIDASEIPY
jgi:hypothetical protein